MTIQNGELANAKNFNAAFVSNTKIGAPSGVCELQSNSLIPYNRIPNGRLDFVNNNASQSMGSVFSFDILKIREVIIDYQIYRYSVDIGELQKTGQLRLSAKPRQVAEDDKWKLTNHNEEYEGVEPGLSFSKVVTDGVAQLYAGTTNVTGIDHECTFLFSMRIIYA